MPGHLSPLSGWLVSYPARTQPRPGAKVPLARLHPLSQLTVEVAGVILGLQVGDELCLLPQQSCPVQVSKETVLLYLKGTPWKESSGWGPGDNCCDSLWPASPGAQPSTPDFYPRAIALGAQP